MRPTGSMGSSRWVSAAFGFLGLVALRGCGSELAGEAAEPGEFSEVAQAALSPNPCTAVQLTAPAQHFTITPGVPVVLTGVATCPPGKTPEYQYWARRSNAPNWTSLGPRTAYVSGSTTWTPPDDGGWCVTVVARAVGAPENYQARASAKCSAPRCGNAVVDPGEQCDDGNTNDGDGCDRRCRLPVRVHVPTEMLDGFQALFYGPDNQLITRSAFTDEGLASAAMPDGGTVIVVRDPVTDSTEMLRAVFGIEPGDDINLFPVVDVHGGDVMTITVPEKPGTSVYRAGTRCGGGGSTTTTLTAFIFQPTCEPPLEVVVQAEGPGGNLLGALRGTASSNTSATLTGPYLAPETVSLSIINGSLPVTVDSELFPIVEHTFLNGLGKSSPQTPLAANATLALGYLVAPSSIVDARRLDVELEQPSRFQRYERVLAPTDVAITLDDRAVGLPWYELHDYDVATRTVRLARTAGAALDGQIVTVNFANDFTPQKSWNCVIPPDATEVVLPVLPADLSDFDPSGPLFTAHSVVPIGIRASEYDGYGDLRRNKPLTAPIGSSFDISTAIVPGL